MSWIFWVFIAAAVDLLTRCRARSFYMSYLSILSCLDFCLIFTI